MGAYYNEIDPFAAAWLRELIKAGHIAAGVVDERDVRDVRPDDLRSFTQCHFFAGIGVWSYALRLAGWPDERPVWTGSCPCQPFSAAGKGGGFADERHLWPAQFHLIRECRPVVWFGEQVASRDGLAWLGLVQADLEGEGYAVGAVDTCSAGFGAPHIRQRLRIAAQRLADADDARSQGWLGGRDGTGECVAWASGVELQEQPGPVNGVWRSAGGLADTSVGGGRTLDRQPGAGFQRQEPAGRYDLPCGVADADGWDASAKRLQRGWQQRQQPEDGRSGFVRLIDRPGPTNGFWRSADWLYCRDNKWRPVEPGAFPLAHGAPARVGRLRGYGNAVDAEATCAFIEAFTDVLTA